MVKKSKTRAYACYFPEAVSLSLYCFFISGELLGLLSPPPPLSTMSSIHKILEICLIGEGKDGKLVLHWCETRVTSGSVSVQIKLISKSSCISVPCFSCYRMMRKGQWLYNLVRCSVGSGDW